MIFIGASRYLRDRAFFYDSMVNMDIVSLFEGTVNAGVGLTAGNPTYGIRDLIIEGQIGCCRECLPR